MFDYIRCKYPLPEDGFVDHWFQTKDTPNQSLDDYEIREDGSLWVKKYDTEDRSDHNAVGLRAVGLKRFFGFFSRVNKRWSPENITGEILFYGFPTKNYHDGGWIEFSAYFVSGKIKELHVISNDPPNHDRPAGQ